MTIPSIYPVKICTVRDFKGVGRDALGVLLLCFVLCAGTLSAQTYADLYDFPGKPGGCCPQHPSVMAQGRDGDLYGITTTGGVNNVGTIFKISPTGGLTLLFSFDTTHGSTPIGGLVLGLDGNLYGTAELGGTHGFGTIFKITPAGVLTVIYDFAGETDGGFPVAALILGSDGNFYGTSHPGIAFKVTPAGVFTALATIPSESFGPLVLAKDGSYYGVTEFAGTNTDGTIYKVTGKASKTLYNFDGPHGAFPIGGLVEGSDGNLYGTTSAGGSFNDGEIFRINPAGTLTVLVNFDHNQPLLGYQTFAGLIAGNDGNLYGATIWGGENGNGVVFEMTTAGAYSVLYSFASATGDGVYATPMEHTNGSIYGLTKRGGAPMNGVVFAFNSSLPPFARLMATSGTVGKSVGILGNNLNGTSGVTFNGTPASFHVLSDTYLTATVPSGETGSVRVITSSGELLSNKIFKVTPKLTSFSPTTGKVGDSIVLTGTGLIQASNLTVGGVKVTSYTVSSDSKVTIRVPRGAKTGKLAVTTPGGNATSTATFTVTP
ncbi:MAG TPA: choice-of-anchor tandem repeat GloVer-containing protein [Candidatus Acidoferrales bacterium]|nr:choice-of-anchor tandem repeat GloVer-containing protein [Candidatus Acidoferrales bacterium]